MIRNRIKKRREKRKANKAGKKDESSDDSFDKIDEAMIENDENKSNTAEESAKSLPTTECNTSNANASTLEIDENFNYLTDICKDKKFNKKELGLILRVIKLELQPLIYLLLFIKGTLLWRNTAFTLITMIVLLYFAYLNIVNYLFGLSLLLLSLLMFGMKTNPERTVFSLALLVGLVAPIDIEEEDQSDKKEKENTKESEKQLKRWQLIQRAKRVKRKVQQKFIQLGEFQYLLYQLSIYIGKIRAVYFQKDEKCGQILMYFYGVCGLLAIILPLRVNYAMMVLLVFSAKPLLKFIKMKRGKDKEGLLKKKAKSLFAAIHPDIPKIQLNTKNEQ